MPSPSSYPSYHRYSPRASDDDDSAKQTIIIITVCASVGGIVVLLGLYRVCRHFLGRRASKKAPLPPIQPLAHRRGQQIVKFQGSESRPNTFYGPGLARPFDASLHASESSLIGKEKIPSSPSTPSRRASSLGHSETGEDISTFSPIEYALPLPNPRFASTSSSSLASSSESDHATIPTSATSSSIFTPSTPARSSSRPRNSDARNPRAPSMTSNSTSASRISRRGLPHQSNVQIILPAPLAPNLFASEGRSQRPGLDGDRDYNSRLSMVDKWAPAITRSESPRTPTRRSTSVAEQRSSVSSSSSHQHAASFHGRSSQRRFKSSSISSHASISTPSPAPSQYPDPRGRPPPPVPRIPSIYSNSSSSVPTLSPGSGESAVLGEETPKRHKEQTMNALPNPADILLEPRALGLPMVQAR